MRPGDVWRARSGREGGKSPLTESLEQAILVASGIDTACPEEFEDMIPAPLKKRNRGRQF